MTLVADRAGAAVTYTETVGPLPGNASVWPAGRGHRLGAYAKARNLRTLAASHPGARPVRAGTAETGGPMRRVGERCGFRPVERTYAGEAPLEYRAV